MQYKKVLILILVIVTVSILSGCLGGQNDSGGSTSYETGTGMQITESGYSGDPENGNQPATQNLKINLMEQVNVEVIFTLEWSDDAPDSEPDEFELEVTGMISGQEKSISKIGSSGEISLAVKADGFSLDSYDGKQDSLLGSSWDVSVTAISCGSSPLLPIGPGLILNDPDEGNEWTLNVRNTHLKEISSDRKGYNAPEFTVPDTENNEISLSDFNGKVVVLDMMMRCGACENQIKEIKKIYSEYSDRVTFLSVNIDPKDTIDDVSAMKDEHNAQWIFALDTDNVKTKYEVMGMRKLVIISKEREINFKSDDVVDSGKLSKELDAAISGESQSISLGSSSITVIAFLTGITAFFAPCAFPMLPGYVTYYMSEHRSEGEEQASKPNINKKQALKKGLYTGIITGMGLATVYIIFGLLLSLFGAPISSSMFILAPIIAVLVIIIGLTFIFGIPINLELYFYRFRKLIGIESAYKKWRERKGINAQDVPNEEQSRGHKGLYYYGFGYGAASTGCHGVAFISIVLVGLASSGFTGGMGASILWVIGMAMIMIIVTILLAMAKNEIISKITENIEKINKITGVLLVVAGIAIILYLL
jgi:cytochrome c-type biogenesis protein